MRERVELVLSFRVRPADVFLLHLDTWLGRMMILGGLLIALTAVSTPFHNEATIVTCGLGGVAFGVLGMPLWGALVSGGLGTVGKQVDLTFTEYGVRGWPPAGDAVVDWRAYHAARLVRGVILLRFRSPFRGRQWWIPIPYGRLSEADRQRLKAYLTEKVILEGRL